MNSCLLIGDPVNIKLDKMMVLSLQKKANLSPFDYDLFKNRTGFVASILKDKTVKINFVISDVKHVLHVNRDVVERILMKVTMNSVKTFGLENEHTSSLEENEEHKAKTLDERTNTNAKILSHEIKNKNFTQIEYLINTDNVELLRKVCHKNQHINDVNDKTNETLFHIAARKGNWAIMDVLREEGCNPNAVDFDGDSFLNYAIYDNKLSSIDYIIEYYPYLLKETNNKFETPLLLACRKKNIEVSIKLLKKDNTVINHKDIKGNAVIHYTAGYGGEMLMETLLKCRKLDLTLRNANEMTAFHIACKNGQESIVSEIMKYCNNNKCLEILHLQTSRNESGAQLAVINGHIDIALNIITTQPTLWSKQEISKKHGSILHSAVLSRKLKLIETICVFDLKLIGIKNSEGKTPLDLALLLSKDKSRDVSLEGLNIVKILRQENLSNHRGHFGSFF